MKTRTLDKRSLEDYLVKMDFLGYKLRTIDKENNLFIVKHYEK